MARGTNPGFRATNQQVFAGRDAYVSARDQKIEVRNYRQSSE